MAVNVGQRNVPDTPANRQLEAAQKALDLALHTIKICDNDNVFDPKYRASLTNDIIECAKQIYLDDIEQCECKARKKETAKVGEPRQGGENHKS